jgi:hypothetical protein
MGGNPRLARVVFKQLSVEGKEAMGLRIAPEQSFADPLMTDQHPV